MLQHLLEKLKKPNGKKICLVTYEGLESLRGSCINTFNIPESVAKNDTMVPNSCVAVFGVIFHMFWVIEAKHCNALISRKMKRK